MEENEAVSTEKPGTTAEEATTVGMYLKYMRLKQKKSIETVSEALCIRRIYIKALEEDDFEELAPVPYGIGFVRSYANYLGLNADRVVQFYKQQALPKKEKPVVPMTTEKKTSAIMPAKRHIYIGLAIFLGLYIVWLVIDMMQSKPAPKETVQPVAEVVEIVPMPEDDEAGVPSSDAEQNTDSEQQVTITEEVYQEPEVIKQPILMLKVKGETWLEVKDANKVYLSGIKNKGFVFETELQEGMELSIGKYYNVDTYLDGVLTQIAKPKKQTKISLDPFLKH